jgi:hypothetical protein
MRIPSLMDKMWMLFVVLEGSISDKTTPFHAVVILGAGKGVFLIRAANL